MASQLVDSQTKKLLLGTVLVGAAIVLFGHHDLLDARFYYSGEYAQIFFSLLSPDQNRAYLRTGILDLVFIHFYSSLVWYQFTKLQASPKFRKLSLTPSLFDLFETVSILLILLTGVIPTNLDWLGLLTATKWISALFVFVWWVVLLFNRRRKSHSSI